MPKIFGRYGISTLTGTMAAGLLPNSELFQARWTSSTVAAVVYSLKISAGDLLGFTAGLVKLEVMIARSFTSAGTGGVTATLTTDNCKLEPGETTTMDEIRTATTAALGVGTKSLDSQGIGIAASSVVVTAGQPIFNRPVELLVNPVRLVGSMGLIVRATVPATGTWHAGFQMIWEESPA